MTERCFVAMNITIVFCVDWRMFWTVSLSNSVEWSLSCEALNLVVDVLVENFDAQDETRCAQFRNDESGCRNK